MKKIVILLVYISISSFVLSACFPTNEQKDSSGSVNLNITKDSTPNFIDIELDNNLIVKANITGIDSKKLRFITTFCEKVYLK